MDADGLFLQTLDWLQTNYGRFRFFTERDVVWTVQLRLLQTIADQNLPLQVFNDYGLLPGKNRSLSADLVILDEAANPLVAIEFKYEPSHQRTDIPQKKLKDDIVFWEKDGVKKDIDRIQEFAREVCPSAYAILVDEGGRFRRRTPHPGSEWRQWGGNIWVLYARAPASDTGPQE